MLKVKLQYFGHLMRRVDSLEKTLMLGGIGGRRRREWQRMRWLDGITDSMDEFKWTLGAGDGQGGLVCCDSWGHKQSDMTKQLNWTELTEIACSVGLLHMNLQVVNFQRCECVFHPCQAWVTLKLVLQVSYCWWSFSSTISHLLSRLQSVTLPACSWMPTPVCPLLYWTTILFKVPYCKIQNIFFLKNVLYV